MHRQNVPMKKFSHINFTTKLDEDSYCEMFNNGMFTLLLNNGCWKGTKVTNTVK